MDESLRELERACEADPKDGSARVRLASELARAGRSREALERLELASLSDEHFPAGRKLADELWLRELSGLEPREAFPCPRALDVALDESTTLAALRARGGGVTVVTLRTGEVHHRDPRQDLVPSAPGKIFVASNEHLTSISREDGHVEVTTRERSPVELESPDIEIYESVESVSRGGDMIFVHTLLAGDPDYDNPGSAARVLAWPSLETIIERPTTVNAHVDWTTRLLMFVHDEDTPFWDAVGFDGTPAARIEAMGLTALGAGLLSCGYRIFDLVSKRGLAIPRERAAEMGPLWSESASLSSDGRGLRTVTRKGGEGKALRHEIDRRGPFDDAPADRSLYRSLWRDLRDVEAVVWHPHADVLTRSRKGVFTLYSLDGVELVRFPDLARPIAWKDGGHALAVMRDGGASTARLEIWRGRGA